MLALLRQLGLGAYWASFQDCGATTVEALHQKVGQGDLETFLRDEVGASVKDAERMAQVMRQQQGTNGYLQIQGSTGSIYSPTFLQAVQPLYDLHMGTENMAPLLYSLVRFIKPSSILEIGAGYTSPFLLQALSDNAAEIAQYLEWRDKDECYVDTAPWSIDSFFYSHACVQAQNPMLHCLDNMAHEHTTAHRFTACAKELGIDRFLSMHEVDAWEYASTLDDGSIGFMWVDFGVSTKLDTFFSLYGRVLLDGGYVLIHSTMTNTLTRQWMNRLKKREVQLQGMGCYDVVSFLEPHKMFQNSFTLIQKRVSYEEPVYTKYP